MSSPPTTETVLQHFREYLRLRGYMPDYHNHVAQYLAYCTNATAQLDYRTPTFATLNAYLLSLKDRGWQPGSLNAVENALKFFYGYLVQSGAVAPEALAEAKKLKYWPVPTKIRPHLTEAQFETLMRKVITFGSNPYRAKAVLMMLFYSGIRPKELCQLRRSDFDFERRRALVRAPNKTARERYVWFTHATKEALQTYFAMAPEQHNALNMQYENLTSWCGKLNEYHSFGFRISSYTFRHSFGMHLAYKGVDVAIAQVLMGHANIQTTLIYYRITQDTAEKKYHQQIG